MLKKSWKGHQWRHQKKTTKSTLFGPESLKKWYLFTFLVLIVGTCLLTLWGPLPHVQRKRIQEETQIIAAKVFAFDLQTTDKK